MKDENKNIRSDEGLNSAEFSMVRSRIEQLDEDRSGIPAPDRTKSRIVRFAKKRPFATAVIAVICVTVIVCSILVGILLGEKAALNSKKDYLFIMGKEEYKYKYERVIIDDVLYVDMNLVAQYAEIPVSGSDETMKYFLSDDEYVKFTNESEYAVINAIKVVLPYPAIVEGGKCLVPYSVVSKVISDGISFSLDSRKHTVTVKRETYEEEGIEYFEDIHFSAKEFTEVGALKDTSGIDFEYNRDVTAVLKYIDPDKKEAFLILVNPSNPLGSDYVPEGLELIPQKYTGSGNFYLNKTAVEALCAMMMAMQTDIPSNGAYVTSAYRSYSYQVDLFETYVKRYTSMGYTREAAETEVLKTSARPGSSEHQSGLCVDFITTSMKNGLNNEEFERTSVFEWLSDNAYKYGFILRYPKNKTELTQYDYESWHYRFVGREAATAIYFSDICLEEYLEYV